MHSALRVTRAAALPTRRNDTDAYSNEASIARLYIGDRLGMDRPSYRFGAAFWRKRTRALHSE